MAAAALAARELAALAVWRPRLRAAARQRTERPALTPAVALAALAERARSAAALVEPAETPERTEQTARLLVAAVVVVVVMLAAVRELAAQERQGASTSLGLERETLFDGECPMWIGKDKNGDDLNVGDIAMIRVRVCGNPTDESPAPDGQSHPCQVELMDYPGGTHGMLIDNVPSGCMDKVEE